MDWHYWRSQWPLALRSPSVSIELVIMKSSQTQVASVAETRSWAGVSGQRQGHEPRTAGAGLFFPLFFHLPDK